MSIPPKIQDYLERAKLHINMREYHVAVEYLQEATFILQKESEPIPPEIQELREMVESALMAERYRDKAITLLR